MSDHDERPISAWRSTCVWCGKTLLFDIQRGGWIHAATGKLYETRIGADGVERDDHCALPSGR